MDMELTLLILCVVCCIGLLLFVCRQGRLWLLRRNGGYGNYRIERLLDRFARPRYYKALHHVALHAGNESRPVEHVLVYFGGILLVKVVEEEGEYFGEKSAKDWLRTTEDYKRVRIPNHVAELEETAVFLRSILGAKGIYRTHIDTLVVFAGRPKNTVVGVSNCGELVTTLKALPAYLKQTKFEKDTGVNVDALAEVFVKSRG